MTPELATTPASDDRYPLPIFVFLSALLAVTVGGALQADASLRGGLPAAGILGLLAVHLVLHWSSPRVADRTRPWLQYVLAQGGLAIALTIATGSPSVWAAAFTWLLGEAVGMLDKARLAALTLVLDGLLGVAALFAIADTATALSWLGAVLPTALFVGLVVVLYKRQVEAREHAQRLVQELAEANRRIAAYAAQVEALTLANERQRLARELHDTLAQDVTGLVLQMEAVHAHLDAGHPARAQAIVEHAMARARATVHAARAAIDDLRVRAAPTSLRTRLETLAEQVQAQRGIACAVTIDEGSWDSALAVAQQEQLERIVAEAVANIHRHAKATHVTIEVRATADTLRLRVTDNGVGFDPAQVPPTGHYGLRGLHERARVLGATLQIVSAPGVGTTIQLELPLARVASRPNDDGAARPAEL